MLRPDAGTTRALRGARARRPRPPREAARTTALPRRSGNRGRTYRPPVELSPGRRSGTSVRYARPSAPSSSDPYAAIRSRHSRGIERGSPVSPSSSTETVSAVDGITVCGYPVGDGETRLPHFVEPEVDTDRLSALDRAGVVHLELPYDGRGSIERDADDAREERALRLFHVRHLDRVVDVVSRVEGAIPYSHAYR